jgi:hypothetical protein
MIKQGPAGAAGVNVDPICEFVSPIDKHTDPPPIAAVLPPGGVPRNATSPERPADDAAVVRYTTCGASKFGAREDTVATDAGSGPVRVIELASACVAAQDGGRDESPGAVPAGSVIATVAPGAV